MKYKINIYPESRTENTKLFGTVTYRRTKLRFQIARIDADSPKKWNAETSRCLPNTRHGRSRTHAAVINDKIEKFYNAVDAFFVIHADDKELPPTEELKRYVKSRMTGEDQQYDDHTIYDDYETFILSEASLSGWSLATTQKHKTIIKNLKSVNPRLKYNDITPNFFATFAKHLADKGNRTDTVKKKLTFFEWFLKWAESRKLAPHVEKYTDTLKLKSIKRPVIFLSWEELMQVYNLDLTKHPHLERARDVFCFQCFTGLRYSDLAALKKHYIYDDAIHIVTQKTTDPLIIELNDYSRAILEKYKDYIPDPATLHHIPRERAQLSDYALPVISSQRYNSYIKDFTKAAKIDTPIQLQYFVGNTRKEKTQPKYELITSHAARRTFICTALTLGIPITTIMKWSGHKSYESMKPYIDVTNQEKRNAMQLFNKPQQQNHPQPQEQLSKTDPQ